MVPVAAHAGDDSANTDENVGVDEAKDLNNAASDAGKKHFWNPGGQAIEKTTKENEQEFNNNNNNQ